jgi:hypothetical protein
VIDPAQRVPGDGGHQYDDPGCFRNSISSSVERGRGCGCGGGNARTAR